MAKTQEEIKQELENATFIPYDITGDEEKDYTTSKSFFLSTKETIENSINKCAKSLGQANESYEWFLQMKDDLSKKHPNENVAHLDQTIKSLEETIKQLQTTLDTNKQRLNELIFIIESCFTETIENNVAFVQKEGKIFSKYFALVLRGME